MSERQVGRGLGRVIRDGEFYYHIYQISWVLVFTEAKQS